MTLYWSSPDKRIELHLGDCRDVLPAVKSCDLLLTDPPYGVSIHTTGMRKQTKLALDSIAGDHDTSIGEIGVALAWKKLVNSRHAYVFGPFDLTTLPGAFACVDLVWDKGQFTLGNLAIPWGVQTERIAFAVQRKNNKPYDNEGGLLRLRRGNVLRHSRPGHCDIVHPTEKPVALLRELIEASSKHDELVLDPFAGSGSTLHAALIEGRRAIGIEVEEKWCEVAAKRLERVCEQGRLFFAATEGDA